MGPWRRGVALDGALGTLDEVWNLVEGCTGPWRRGVASSTRHWGHLTSGRKPGNLVGGCLDGTLEEGRACPSTRHWGHLTSVGNLVGGCVGPWRRGVTLDGALGTLDEGLEPGGKVHGTLEEGRGLPPGIGDT